MASAALRVLEHEGRLVCGVARLLGSSRTPASATALLGALAILQGDDVVNAKAVKKEDKGQAKARGKMGRGGEKASTNYAIDLYGTNEGTEDASVDKFEGDIDEFYIADAFGSRKEAYGRRVGGASSSVENFNQIFQDVMADQKKGKKGSTPVESALLLDQNVQIWVQKYAAERLTFLKDLDKSFYRITQVGAQYTGGKYAALHGP